MKSSLTNALAGNRIGFSRFQRWIVTILLGGAFAGVAQASALLPRSTYLVLDDRVVDRVERVALKVGVVTKSPANPLFGEDRPWEVRFDNLYPNVARDPASGRYLCWYSPFIVDELTSGTPRDQRAGVPYHSTPTREMGLCLATSEDGLHWLKPDLGVIEFNGDTKNNLVLRHSHGAGVMLDPQEKDPARRFKVFGGRQVAGQKRRMQVAFSADGTHWAEPVSTPEIGVEGDTHNNAIWCPALGKYVGITRRWLAGERLVMRTESVDFTRWTPAVEIMRGDAVNQTYAMTIFPYGEVYLGFTMVMNLKTDRVQCELSWSPDTVLWHRVDVGNALIPNSTRPGDYDWGCVYAGAGPVIDRDGIRIFYGAGNGPHTNWRDGFLAVATLPTDRFAGYVAGAEPGTIVTHPLVAGGGELWLNLDAPSGSARVEVLDENGGRTEGTAVSLAKTDTTEARVTWDAAAASSWRGRVVRLKFTLQNAKLYSFGWR